MTDEKFRFRIDNSTRYSLKFTINGESFDLRPGYYRNFSYPKAYGTNSCNVQSYDNPIIKFDYSFNDGFQAKEYSLDGDEIYKFTLSGGVVDLVK